MHRDQTPSFISVFSHIFGATLFASFGLGFFVCVCIFFFLPELRESLIQVFVVGCKLLKIKHFCIPYVVQLPNAH